MTDPETTAEGTARVFDRLNALRAASEQERLHSDDGKALGPEQECNHKGRGWGPYCEGRRPRNQLHLSGSGESGSRHSPEPLGESPRAARTALGKPLRQKGGAA